MNIRFMIRFQDLNNEFFDLVEAERRDPRDLAVMLIKEALRARREQPDRLREEIREVLKEELQHAA